MWRSQTLMTRGRGPEASAEIQRALELDPFSPVALWTAGRFLSMTGDHERAIELIRRAVDLSPGSSRTRLYLCDAYAAAGRVAEAADTLLAAVPPAAQAELRSAYEAGGLNALLERFLRFEQERSGQPCGFGTAVLYARIGDSDGVFRCLQAAARRGETGPHAQVNPVFAPYRSDPRYAAYLVEMNLRE